MPGITGYLKENGSALTFKEFEVIRDLFNKRFRTRIMVGLGLWSDFRRRREFDKYLLKNGYRVIKKG